MKASFYLIANLCEINAIGNNQASNVLSKTKKICSEWAEAWRITWPVAIVIPKIVCFHISKKLHLRCFTYYIRYLLSYLLSQWRCECVVIFDACRDSLSFASTVKPWDGSKLKSGLTTQLNSYIYYSYKQLLFSLTFTWWLFWYQKCSLSLHAKIQTSVWQKKKKIRIYLILKCTSMWSGILNILDLTVSGATQCYDAKTEIRWSSNCHHAPVRAETQIYMRYPLSVISLCHATVSLFGHSVKHGNDAIQELYKT